MESTLFVAFLLAVGTVCRATSDPVCRNPTDIVFVLDESSSIWGYNFTHQLDFVQSAIETFNIEINQILIGVMTFGNNPRIIFPLGRFTKEQQLKDAVKVITQSGGNTYTNLALKRLREMFLGQYASPSANRVAIVITDGESTSPLETAMEARLCRDENITMIAIGVGKNIVQKELEAIASSNEFVFTVSNYAALESLRQTLAVITCETPTTLPPPTKATVPPIQAITREKRMDQIWSISDQANVKETNLALDFIEGVTREMKVDWVHVRVGLAPKFCDECNGIRLKDYDTHDGFSGGLDKRRLKGLRTDRTLDYIRQVGFISSNGGRSDVVKYGILIVDNRFEDWEKTLREAELSKRENVRLIVIGVGDRVQEDQLHQLAFSSAHYFFVENYDKLVDVKLEVFQRLYEWTSDGNFKLRELFEENY